MTYLPPSIGPAGLTIPSYSDILEYYITSFQSIYGQTVALGNDSADYQFMSITALLASDVMQALQLEYNNRAPNFAVGAALDSLVKLNGLARKSATYSTCTVTLTGTPGAVINNGIVADVNGNQWTLPSVVTIGAVGQTSVTATCTVSGAVNAVANQITTIVTPSAGWNSVTNGPNVASVGQPVESDAQLRARQAISTELPSETLLAGTVAAIAATPGVTRYNVLENPTGATDSYGNPPHSVTAVVEGGTDAAVATAIFDNRGIGPFTNGTTTVAVTDPNTGIVMNISFDRPSYIPIYIIVNIHALPGYTSDITAQIATALVTYLNSLQIGELLTVSALYAVIMSITPYLAAPLFSVYNVYVGTAPSPSGSSDIVVNFNEVVQGAVANIAINSV